MLMPDFRRKFVTITKFQVRNCTYETIKKSCLIEKLFKKRKKMNIHYYNNN